MLFFGKVNLSIAVQARPTMYQVVKDMIEKMGYSVSFEDHNIY